MSVVNAFTERWPTLVIQHRSVLTTSTPMYPITRRTGTTPDACIHGHELSDWLIPLIPVSQPCKSGTSSDIHHVSYEEQRVICPCNQLGILGGVLSRCGRKFVPWVHVKVLDRQDRMYLYTAYLSGP